MGKVVKGQDETYTRYTVLRAIPCPKGSCGCGGGMAAGQAGGWLEVGGGRFNVRDLDPRTKGQTQSHRQ